MPKTVTVELTAKEIGVLRRLIVEEARRLGHGHYQRKSEEPSKLRRMTSVAKKIWEARQEIVACDPN